MLNTKLPLVSVCIPTYNGEKYLDQCLTSMLSQTFLDYEIIIVDDFSSDGTLDIANSYAKKHEFIHVFKNEKNLGLVGNWNRCVDHASGRWIKFLFQDDWLDPVCLEKMVEAGEKTSASLVVCRREFIFENASNAIREEYSKFLGKYSPDNVFSGKEIIDNVYFCKTILSYIDINYIGEPTAVLIRRKIFDELGKFDSSFIQLCDLEFFLRVGVRYGMTFVPETLAFFRVHQSSTTSLNAKSKVFLKDIIDPLLLRLHFCSKPLYDTLREVDLQVGFGLQREFENKLRYEQLWGEYRHDSQWNAIIRKHQMLKMPFFLRMKRFAKKCLHR